MQIILCDSAFGLAVLMPKPFPYLYHTTSVSGFHVYIFWFLPHCTATAVLVGHSVSSTQEPQLQRNSLGSSDWILRLNNPPGQTRSRTNGAISYVHVLQSDHDWHFNLWQFSGMPIAEHLVKPGIFFATPHFEMWEPRVCLQITHTWWCAFQECSL